MAERQRVRYDWFSPGTMTIAGQCQVRSLAWLLGALCALGCGIAQRTVEEREEGTSNGATSGRAATPGGATAGGHASGNQAGKSAPAHGGEASAGVGNESSAAGEAPDSIGVELDPVPVSDGPLPACYCGEGCMRPSCGGQTVGTAAAFLMNVFVRGGDAYWMSLEQLDRAPSDGRTGFGAGQYAMVGQLQFPSRVVVDGIFAYFTSYVGLWRLPRNADNATLSGDAKLLSTFEPWKRRVTEITIDSRHVYWTRPLTDQLPARVIRTSITNGSSVVLARLDNEDDWPLGIAVDDTDVYFTSNARLLRVPKAGGEPEELQRIDAQVPYDQLHPMLGIALDARWVYYDAGNALRRLSKTDGSSVALFNVPEGDALSGVVVDEYYVYFGTRSGNIYRCDKREGPPRLMVTGESNPLVSAVSHDHVYWVEQDAARVRGVTK